MIKKQYIITVCSLALFFSAMPLMGAEEEDIYGQLRAPRAGEQDVKILNIMNLIDHPLWVRVQSGPTMAQRQILYQGILNPYEATEVQRNKFQVITVHFFADPDFEQSLGGRIFSPRTHAGIRSITAKNIAEGVKEIGRHSVGIEILYDFVGAPCQICFENINAGEEVSILPCGHQFHEACLRDWLARSPTCPQCRQAAPAGSVLRCPAIETEESYT